MESIFALRVFVTPPFMINDKQSKKHTTNYSTQLYSTQLYSTQLYSTQLLHTTYFLHALCPFLKAISIWSPKMVVPLNHPFINRSFSTKKKSMLIGFSWIFHYKPSILGYPHWIPHMFFGWSHARSDHRTLAMESWKLSRCLELSWTNLDSLWRWEDGDVIGI